MAFGASLSSITVVALGKTSSSKPNGISISIDIKSHSNKYLANLCHLLSLFCHMLPLLLKCYPNISISTNNVIGIIPSLFVIGYLARQILALIPIVIMKGVRN